MGCALAAAGAPSLDACKAACAKADAADCTYAYKNVTLNMCGNCPPGCDASDGVGECLEGCRLAFGAPAPPPPPPCGQGGPCWDSGRYSESKVVHDPATGLFHMFATASAVGGDAAHANKIVEQVGWAVSADGLHFSEYASNPIGPQRQPRASGPPGWATTPLTSAMAEGRATARRRTRPTAATARTSASSSSPPRPSSGSSCRS